MVRKAGGRSLRLGEDDFQSASFAAKSARIPFTGAEIETHGIATPLLQTRIADACSDDGGDDGGAEDEEDGQDERAVEHEPTRGLGQRRGQRRHGPMLAVASARADTDPAPWCGITKLGSPPVYQRGNRSDLVFVSHSC